MKRSGQTMLELVIAAGVISVSVIAALTLIIKTIDLAQQSQLTVEAGNYAREGVEVVRMIRDSNWLDIDDNVSRCGSLTLWDSDGDTANSCPRMNGSYIASFDPLSSGWKLLPCTASNCTGQNALVRLGNYTTQSLTSVPGSTATSFQRTITLTPDTETATINGKPYTLSLITITVNVTWKNGSRKVTLHEKLYNWR